MKHFENSVLYWINYTHQALDFSVYLPSQTNTNESLVSIRRVNAANDLAEMPCATVQMFHLKRPVYTLQGKLYDFLFVTAPIDATIRSDFLRKCHSAVKNGGNIIFFLPKNDFALRDSWTMLLTE